MTFLLRVSGVAGKNIATLEFKDICDDAFYCVSSQIGSKWSDAMLLTGF